MRTENNASDCHRVPAEPNRLGTGSQNKEQHDMKCRNCGGTLQASITDLPFKVSNRTQRSNSRSFRLRLDQQTAKRPGGVDDFSTDHRQVGLDCADPIDGHGEIVFGQHSQIRELAHLERTSHAVVV
jgi:hypothetical protein